MNENSIESSCELNTEFRRLDISDPSEISLSYDSVGATKVFGAIVAIEDDNHSYKSGISQQSSQGSHSLSYSPSPALHSRKFYQVEKFKSINKKVEQSIPRLLKFEPTGKENQNSNKKVYVKHNNYAKSSSRLVHKKQSNYFRSVNQSLNASRRAREKIFNDKMKRSNRLREERRLEKEEGLTFSNDVEKTRREVNELQRQVTSKYAKARVEQKRSSRQARLENTEKELQFKSRVFREHKKKIKDIHDQKRRVSIELRTKIRNENREGNRKMLLAKIDEDKGLIQERYMSSIAIKEIKEKTAKDRRRSFQFRNEHASQIKKIYEKREEKKKQDIHQSYELKWAGEADAKEYEKQCEENRRKSLAFRNEDGHRQRELEDQRNKQCQIAEHESYELKWAGEADAKDYKKKREGERRNSLAFRNQDGNRQRELQNQREKQHQVAEHESYELKWAGEADAKEYKNQCEEERRKSLALRNQDGYRQRELQDQHDKQRQVAEHESYELKWAGEADAKEYEKQCEEERRISFALRNQDGYRQREFQYQHDKQRQVAEHESYELKWAGEADAKEYIKKLEKERRDSFASRNKKGFEQRVYLAELLAIVKEKETESLMLKWAGEKDAANYLKEEEKKRRESLKFRNQEGKRHRFINEQLRQQKIAETATEEKLQAACTSDVRKYRAQCEERDRQSLIFRRNEAIIQRIEEDGRLGKEKERLEKDRKLETEAQKDVADYVKDCKRRKRFSLAFRAKEKRRHEKWKKQQAELKRKEFSEEVKNRTLDHLQVQLAKERERAGKAMDALRRAQCNFAVNPFISLID